MSRDYKWKTPEGIIDELRALPNGTSVDFTFDSPEEEDKNFFPSAWYGVKILDVFNTKVLCIGLWGGGCFETEEIFEDDDMYEIFDDYCSEYGQNYMLCVSNNYNGE